MEYSLLVIKPNCFMEEISKLVEWQLAEYGIDIVKKKMIRLSRAQLDDAFTTKADRKEFMNYMSSGEVNVYLVYAEYAVHKLKQLKKKIRQMWKTGKNELNNIVHSADEGIEYYKQFCVFFPELDIFNYSGYVDFQVKVNKDNIDEVKKKILKKHNNIFSIVYNDENLDLVRGVFVEGYSNCIFGRELVFEYKGISYSVICYAKEIIIDKIESINDATSYYEKKDGFIALSSFSLTDYDDEVLRYIREKGVKAAFCTPSAKSLFLSRNIQEYLESFGFVVIHGAEKNEGIFEISDSKKTFENLMG